MKFRYIIPVFIIFFITLIGYTLQPNIRGAVEIVQIEEEYTIDYREEIAPFLDSFQLYLSHNISRTRLVGAAVAVVYKGQVVMLEPYGVRKVNTQDSVTPNTVFRLASVSKGFGGVLAAKLHNHNILDLDTTVISYLPDFRLRRRANQHTITIKNLLSHTTGVVAHSFDPSIEAGASFASIYHSFPVANITAQTGRVYTYQNALFSVFDSIAHKQTGYSIHQLLQDSIFSPLGMYDASTSFSEFTESDNFAYPHALNRRGVFSQIRLNPRYYSVTSAAGINASITDMSKWLQALLGHHEQVISMHDIETITVPQISSPIPYITQKNWGGVSNRSYGLGWRILRVQNNTVIQHGGFVDGYRAEIAFCSDKEIGIVFLSNSPHLFIAEVVPYFMIQFFEYYNTVLEQEQNLASIHTVYK